MIKRIPIVFRPYFKQVIWGGDKICAYKRIPAPADHIGESWEISAIPGHESTVAYGCYEGMTLSQLIDAFGATLLGPDVMKMYNGRFPLLIKFIDATDDLSVQVHPDDRLAMERHGCRGKTEMWYIIDSTKDAKVFAGLRESMTPDEFTRRVADGSFSSFIAESHSGPGDSFFLPAGTVHAIGAGNMLVEIQESSDITYRIYDYDRCDAHGNRRELHTEPARDAIDFSVRDDYATPPPPAQIHDVRIAECPYFTVRRIIICGDDTLSFDPRSFTVIICVAGEAVITAPDGEVPIRQGETVLCPAALHTVNVSGGATLLAVQTLSEQST